jgi:hypothetical protein
LTGRGAGGLGFLGIGDGKRAGGAHVPRRTGGPNGAGQAAGVTQGGGWGQVCTRCMPVLVPRSLPGMTDGRGPLKAASAAAAEEDGGRSEPADAAGGGGGSGWIGLWPGLAVDPVCARLRARACASVRVCARASVHGCVYVMLSVCVCLVSVCVCVCVCVYVRLCCRIFATLAGMQRGPGRGGADETEPPPAAAACRCGTGT